MSTVTARTPVTTSMPFQLDDQQTHFVQAHIGPTLVLGGAGTGKTTALLARNIHLAEQGHPPHTFTVICRSAPTAEHYVRQLEEHAPELAQNTFVGTMARFAANFCRHAGATIGGFPRNFTTWTPQQCVHLIASITAHHYPAGSPEARAAPSQIQSWLTFSRNTANPLDYTPAEHFWLDIAAEYDRIKRVHHAMDIDDLVENMNNALLYQDDVRQAWAKNRTRHILLDDFQDVSSFQYETMKLLISDENSLSIACDPNQSSMRHHGADPALINEFIEDFPQFNHQILVNNKRSTPNILRTAEAFKAHPETPSISNDHQLPTQPRGSQPTIRYAHQDDDYRRFLETIIVSTDDASNSSTVIFCPNARFSRNISSILTNMGLHHQMHPPQHENDNQLLLFLKLAANPDDVDALRQLLNARIGSAHSSHDHPIIQAVVSLSESADCDLIAATGLLARHTGNLHLIGQKLDQISNQAQTIEQTLNTPNTTLAQAITFAQAILTRGSSYSIRKNHVDYQRTSSAALAIMPRPYEDLSDLLLRYLDDFALRSNDPPCERQHAITVATYQHAKSFQPNVAIIAGISESALPTDPKVQHPDQVAENQRTFLNMIASPAAELHIIAPADNPASILLTIHDTLHTPT